MTRQKVKLAFIVNEAKRKATFKKRLNGFLNKVSDLSTLCGVNACAIVYSPYDTKPNVWPSTLGVQRMILLFNSMPETKKNKQMLNQETFLRKRIAKVNEQLKKQQTENREKVMIELMIECLLIGKTRIQNLSQSDRNDLGHKIKQKLTEINKRMEDLRNTTTLQQISTPPPQPLMSSTLQQFAPSIPVAPPLSCPPKPNVVQGQERNQSQFFNYLVNQPMDDMVYAQVWEYQTLMPLTNNSTIAWPNGPYDPTTAYVASNAYGLFNSS